MKERGPGCNFHAIAELEFPRHRRTGISTPSPNWNFHAMRRTATVNDEPHGTGGSEATPAPIMPGPG